jgi:V/A-type H+-transporting ATPase subunit D
MAKIKHTKNEMKAQKDALARYERYLPMLQLKKQQLQAEVQRITAKAAATLEAETARRKALDAWVRLLSEPTDLEGVIVIRGVRMCTGRSPTCLPPRHGSMTRPT